MVWRRGGVLAGVAGSMVLFVGVAGASTGSLVRSDGARVGPRSQMTLAQAPVGLRAAVRRTLGPAAASGSSSQQAELTASDGGVYDSFGWAVSIYGSTAVVGALSGNSGTGAAYVFVRSGSTWSQQAELTPSDGFGGDDFGVSVAISGSTVLVGSPYSTAAGLAYVFVRSGSTWSQQAELTAADGGAWDAFGEAVALSGSTAVIGAPSHNSDAGAAYVFVQSGVSWSQEDELTAADGASGDYFGSSVSVSSAPVSLSRSTVVVGAPSKNSSTGAAYVFVQSGTSWPQQAELAGDGAKYAQFGVSVAVSGATAVVGEIGTSGNPGAAYVFVQSGTSWPQEAKLTASDGAAGDAFGLSVAIYHYTAVIGAPYHNSDAGAAYVFVRSGVSWSQSAELIASDRASGDHFGSAVAIYGPSAIVGAPLKKRETGAAYVFEHL